MDCICNQCKTNNFVEIAKKQSNKEKRTGKELKFVICKTCEPVMASLSLLDDGYEIAVKIFSPKQEQDSV